MIEQVVIFVAVVAVLAIVGIGLGMLVAPRLGRLAERVTAVEESDGEVQSRQIEGWMQLQCFAERSRRRLVVELLEQRDADVVRAVGALAIGVARCLAEDIQSSGTEESG